ncbi:MAG TPA: hypothetical protein VK589_24465 [Chryseolinea sp.]|nr:hypothetical protein [Chryseolinea sp.]
MQQIIFGLLFLSASCNSDSHESTNSHESNLVIANEFIDAFYSFNRDSLESILSEAKLSQPSILYYQKWAECGNYKVITRNDFIGKNDSIVLCPVTVKDDLMAGLNINFNVTDTFHLTITQGRIRSVVTSSNDPDVYYDAKEWVKQNRPDLIEKTCEGIWAGGPTPCECILGMIKGFKEFVAHQKH